jgi:hypothetical protein
VADTPAIDRDHHLCACGGERTHARLTHAVAVAQAMRNVERRLVPQRAQKAHQDGAAADAVDVVVAVDAYALTGVDRP